MKNHETRTFTRALFDSAPEGLWVLLWTSHDRRSHWFPVGDWDGIAERVDALSADAGPVNVYIGAGLLPDNLGPKTRGKAEGRAGIPGVWVDIDYGIDGHQKTNLPPNIGGAWQIVNDLPLPPTLVVHSGYGLQAWWLFHEFWTFDEPDEWERAESLVRGWNATVRSSAGKHGWTVDSTWDLARVMRLPGTFNTKRATPAPVTISQIDSETRYSPEDIEHHAQAETAPTGGSGAPQAAPESDLPSDLPSDPPLEKFQNLYANDEDFKRTYDHKRRMSDDSLSGYDLALANIAVRAGWTDDEIVGLLVAHRRHYGGGGPKHKGYYEATLKKARAGTERVQAASQLEELLANREEADPAGMLSSVSAQLGVQITGLIEYMGDEPTYRLETTESSVMLGSAAVLASQSKFRTKMIEVAGFLPDPVKAREWTQIVNALLAVRKRESTGEENSERGVVTEWLNTYLARSVDPLPFDQVERAVYEKAPFMTNSGELCIYSTSLRSFVIERAGDRVTRNQLAAMLRGIGCEPKTIGFQRTDGSWTTTAVWLISQDALYSDFSSARAHEDGDF